MASRNKVISPRRMTKRGWDRLGLALVVGLVLIVVAQMVGEAAGGGIVPVAELMRR